MVGSYIGGDNRMRIAPGDVTLSYLPLAHIYQRGVELVVTVLGVTVAYYSGNMLNLQEDLQLLKPTVFIGVPRVFTRVLDKIKAGIAQKPFFLQWLVAKALASKRARYKQDPSSVSAFFPDLVSAASSLSALQKKSREREKKRERGLCGRSSSTKSEQLSGGV